MRRITVGRNLNNRRRMENGRGHNPSSMNHDTIDCSIFACAFLTGFNCCFFFLNVEKCVIHVPIGAMNHLMTSLPANEREYASMRGAAVT